MRRGFGLIWLAVTLIIAAVVGVVSYQAGVATQLPAGAAVPPYYGFGLFGLLFFLFLLFVLVRLASFGRWGGRGWGGGSWKHGGYGGGMPPAIEERMQEWHKRAHGQQPPGSGTTSPPPPDQQSV